MPSSRFKPAVMHFWKDNVIYHNTQKLISLVQWVSLIHIFRKFKLNLTLHAHDSLYKIHTFCYLTGFLFSHLFCRPFNISMSSLFPHSVFSYLSRPGPAAPSRSCCLQPGSSSPTLQSSMPLSSPTPWAAHSLLQTGGKQQYFPTSDCSQPVLTFTLGMLNSTYWCLNVKIKALCKIRLMHKITGVGIYFMPDKQISRPGVVL